MNDRVEGFCPEIFSIDVKIKNPNIKRSQILKAIGCPHLKLHDYDDYFSWEYDTYPEDFDDDANHHHSYIFSNQSVPVCKLNHMTLEQWVISGELFVEEMEKSNED